MNLPFPHRGRPFAHMAIERAALSVGFTWLNGCIGRTGYRIKRRYRTVMLGSAAEVALVGISAFSVAGVRMSRFWRSE